MARTDITRLQRDELAVQLANEELSQERAAAIFEKLSATIAREVSKPLSALALDGKAYLRWLRHEPIPIEEM